MDEGLSTGRSRGAGLKELLFRAFLLSFLMIFMAMVLTLIIADMRYAGPKHWVEAFTEGRSEVWFAVKLSLITSTVTLIASLIVGIPSAYALSRFKLPFATFIPLLPLFAPHLAQLRCMGVTLVPGKAAQETQ